MDLQKGDVVIVALQGDYGKPRPAIVVQSNVTLPTSRMIAILPLTSDVAIANRHRVSISPTNRNGLRDDSQTMIERLTSIPKGKLGDRIGVLESETMLEIDNSLRLWLGLI